MQATLWCLCNVLATPPRCAALLRILKYAACSPECFVLALVYIDRLIQQHNLVLSSFNVHRVIITRYVLCRWAGWAAMLRRCRPFPPAGGCQVHCTCQHLALHTLAPKTCATPLHSVMLAAKFFDDHYYNNAFYARVCRAMRALRLLAAEWT